MIYEEPDFTWLDDFSKSLKTNAYMSNSEKNAIKFAYNEFSEEEFLERLYKFIDDSIELERETIYRRVNFLTTLNENIKKITDQLNKNK